MNINTESIKKSVDLRQLAAQFTELKGQNSQTGPCPKCGGKDRFVVYIDRFLCRQCHPDYGDAIEFTRWLNGVDFREACNRLTNGNPPTAAGGLSPMPVTPRPRPILTPPAAEWQEKAAAFVEYAQTQLWQPAGRAGLDYLLGRGFTEQTIKEAGLGFNPQDQPGEKWGLSPLLGPGIVIPWLIDGKPHRVNIRLLMPRQETKYIGPAGWAGANPLYGADSVTPHKPVLLVEGELCALTANQEAGDLITAVATGSKDAAQAGRWIARLSAAPLVLLALDAEEGKGDKAAKKWGELLPDNSKRWRPLLKDVNDMHREGLSIREWIQAGLPTPELPADSVYLACQRATYPLSFDFEGERTTYTTPEEAYADLWARSMVKELQDLGGVIVEVEEVKNV